MSNVGGNPVLEAERTSTPPGRSPDIIPHDDTGLDDIDVWADAPKREGALSAAGLTGALLGAVAKRLHVDSLSKSERRRVVAALFHEGNRLGAFARRFTALMTLAVLIAVLGLLADSTAVVIGAMLVAPLMVPVLGIAAAVVMDWPRRIVRQTVIAGLGAAWAVALAAVVSFILPGTPDPLPGELLARTAPNLIDLGIALVAGAAGAYAQVRRQAADALTGVAVAVALVPPLATIGICLELREFNLALGATLLFMANVVGIVLSASLTFICTGFVPNSRLMAGRKPIARGLRWAVAAAIMIIVPLNLTRGHLSPEHHRTEDLGTSVSQMVEEWMPELDVVAADAVREDGVITVNLVVTSSGEEPDADELAERLAAEFDDPIALGVETINSTSQTATATDDDAPANVANSEDDGDGNADENETGVRASVLP